MPRTGYGSRRRRGRGAGRVDAARRNHDDESPLWVASSRGNCAVADVLLNGGAGVNRATRTGYTPLMIACRQNMIHVATLLCDRGANIEITDPFGYGPLAIASWYGNMEAVALLVRRGAKVNAKSAKGESPLFMAILCACRGGVAHTGDCRSVGVRAKTKDGLRLYDVPNDPRCGRGVIVVAAVSMRSCPPR